MDMGLIRRLGKLRRPRSFSSAKKSDRVINTPDGVERQDIVVRLSFDHESHPPPYVFRFKPGDLVTGKINLIKQLRLHRRDGSSISIPKETVLLITEECNKEHPGPFFKWNVFYCGAIFFAYDEDLEVMCENKV